LLDIANQANLKIVQFLSCEGRASMRKLVYSLGILPFLSGPALAAHPVMLDDPQLDAVTAGATETSGGLSFAPTSPAPYPSYGLLLFVVNEADTTNTGTVIVNQSPVPCANCYLAVGPENLVIEAAFGPVVNPMH
jgi:hypothetical protein